MIDNNKMKPKVLIVSNNSLSLTNNNGKTLESFFGNFNADELAQLYFSSETPNSSVCNRFFRISDNDIVSSFINKKIPCGKEISKNEKDIQKKNDFNVNSKLKKIQIIRLIRELIWLYGNWNTMHLSKWLDHFSPNIIFFCAGDSVFVYRIVDFIIKKYNTKLVVFITDDYVLPRKTISPFWWIRRNIILKQMRKTVISSSLFITISNKMKNAYKDLFGKDSIVTINITRTMKDDINREMKNDETILVYTGGLHLNRYKTLSLLAKSIKKYNIKQSKNKIILRIYSNELPDKRILKKLNVEGASLFCGSLDPINLKKVLNDCSVPVHVESFDKKSIESTRLSISTKIPEYLSLGKPILAIGPNQIASMEYLAKVAYCINNQKELDEKLSRLIEDDNLKIKLSLEAAQKFKEFHNYSELGYNLKSKISEVLSE